LSGLKGLGARRTAGDRRPWTSAGFDAGGRRGQWRLGVVAQEDSQGLVVASGSVSLPKGDGGFAAKAGAGGSSQAKSALDGRQAAEVAPGLEERTEVEVGRVRQRREFPAQHREVEAPAVVGDQQSDVGEGFGQGIEVDAAHVGGGSAVRDPHGCGRTGRGAEAVGLDVEEGHAFRAYHGGARGMQPRQPVKEMPGVFEVQRRPAFRGRGQRIQGRSFEDGHRDTEGSCGL